MPFICSSCTLLIRWIFSDQFTDENNARDESWERLSEKNDMKVNSKAKLKGFRQEKQIMKMEITKVKQWPDKVSYSEVWKVERILKKFCKIVAKLNEKTVIEI